MMRTTVVPVADELLAILRGLGEDPERAVLEATVLELFRRGDLSRGRSAELPGIDLLTFMRLASARGIPVIALRRTSGLSSSMRARSSP